MPRAVQQQQMSSNDKQASVAIPETPAADAASKSHARRSCSDVVPMVTSITDLVVPGLGVTIGAVLLLIKELCKRLLKRKHDRILQVSKRLADLYDHATKMETQGKFAPPEWLMSYRDVVLRFQAFMVACEETNVLVRLVRGAKEFREVQAFEDQVYSLYRSMDFQARSGGSCCIQ